ncbi:uncharacterized protein [Antedon mediterranea]
MYIVFILLLSVKQATGSCNHEGKNCEWNMFAHRCRCQNLGLTCVPRNILECPNIISLQLENNNITEINVTDLMPYKVKLTSLKLSNNQISSIALGSFEGMAHLEELFLARNQLISLQDGIFSGLTSLKKLFLSSNNIKSIEDTVFNNLEELQTLDLSGNKLSTLSSNVFSELVKLRELYLSSNCLIQVPAFLDTMPILTELDLSKNMISLFPRNTLSKLTKLKILELSSNNISFIERNALYNMSFLEELYLDNNTITSLQPNILWGNQEEMSDLQALTIFDIHNNNITEILKDFMRHLPAIETLNLSGNQIQSIEPASFSAMNNLRSLLLRQNQLNYFDSDLFKDETAMDIKECKKEQKTFNYLQDINLSENKMVSAPSANFFTMMPSLKYFELTENQLKCDCDILQIVYWFNSSKHDISSKHFLGKCAMPSNLQGTSIVNVNSKDIADGPCENALIENRNTSLMVNAGEKVIINCNTSGNPSPSICWNVPQSLTHSDLNISMERIVIPEVSNKYEGSYTCNVENVFNNDSVTYRVLINKNRLVTTLPIKKTSTEKQDYSGRTTTESSYVTKQSKLQTFTIIASIFLCFTVVFIIYMVRCHGSQMELCQRHGSESDLRSNRIARDRRRVYKTLVEERENIEIRNLEHFT